MFKSILNLIFPPKCIFCNQILSPSTKLDICNNCYHCIPFSSELVYLANDNNYFDQIICLCKYTGIIKNSLIKYKFLNKSSYCRTFAKLLSQKIRKLDFENKIHLIISVPLHKKRENQRGYNQSKLITKLIGQELHIEEASGVLKRIKNTKSQALLNKQERSTNIKGAFCTMDSSKVKDKVILLFDDILTTGATLNECSKVLKEAGAKMIIVAVIASGRRF